MPQTKNDGFDSDIETTTPDTTAPVSSTDNKANEDIYNEEENGLESAETPEQPEESEADDLENLDALVEKLKAADVPLNKVKRFQELANKNKLTASENEELKKQIEELKAGKTEGQPAEQPKADNSAEDYSDLESALEALPLDPFPEVYDDKGNPIEGGGFSTYKDQYLAFEKQLMKRMAGLQRIGEERKQAAIAKENEYYETLRSEIQEAFVDESGTLDQDAYATYMEALKNDHIEGEKAGKPVGDVKKHLIKYLKSSYGAKKKTPEPEEKDNTTDLIAGRNSKNVVSSDFNPVSAHWDDI